MNGASHLRPMSVGEVLDASIKVYRTFFKVMTKSVAALIVPIYAILVLVIISGLPRVQNPSSSTIAPQYQNSPTGIHTAAVWTLLAAVLVIYAVQWLSLQLALAACFKTVGDGYLGQHPTASDAIRVTLGKLHSIAWIAFLASIVTLVLAVLSIFALGAAGVWVWVTWSVSIPVMLLEGTKGAGALKRSFQLVRGRWWPTFATLAVTAVIMVVAYYIVSFAINVPLMLLGNESVAVSMAGSLIASVVAVTLVTPFQASVITVMYFDLRVRKEGFDLALLANQLGITTGGPGRPLDVHTPTWLPPGPADWQWPAPGGYGWPTAGETSGPGGFAGGYDAPPSRWQTPGAMPPTPPGWPTAGETSGPGGFAGGYDAPPSRWQTPGAMPPAPPGWPTAGETDDAVPPPDLGNDQTDG